MTNILNILKALRPEFEIDYDTELVSSGIVDSFDMIMLVTEIENNYNISIQGVDIIPENFETPKSIAKLLSKYGVEIDI